MGRNSLPEATEIVIESGREGGIPFRSPKSEDPEHRRRVLRLRAVVLSQRRVLAHVARTGTQDLFRLHAVRHREPYLPRRLPRRRLGCGQRPVAEPVQRPPSQSVCRRQGLLRRGDRLFHQSCSFALSFPVEESLTEFTVGDNSFQRATLPSFFDSLVLTKFVTGDHSFALSIPLLRFEGSPALSVSCRHAQSEGPRLWNRHGVEQFLSEREEWRCRIGRHVDCVSLETLELRGNNFAEDDGSFTLESCG